MSVTPREAGPSGWQVLDVTGHDPADLAAARLWAETRLITLGDAHRVDVMLVIGELLDNAFHHADGPLQVRLHRLGTPCEVTVAVADHGGGEPKLRAPGPDGGRGLLLVDRICSAWGVDHHDDGKLVWARVGCEEQDCPG
jgi:anti-sigma regulatory factor (Ser/Thr protein kinase)